MTDRASSLPPERWREVFEAVDRALELDPAERYCLLVAQLSEFARALSIDESLELN